MNTAIAATDRPQTQTAKVRRRSFRPRSFRPRGREAGPLVYLLLAVVIILSLFPLYWILVASSRTTAQMNAGTPPLIPGSQLFPNISGANQEADIPRALIISTIVASAVSLGAVTTSTLAGFALSHLKIRGEKLWLAGIIGTMMVPLQLGIIPLFIIMARLGLVGNPIAVIIPYIATAFGVFFMRQYLLTAMPVELLEAGRVEGASTRRIFWQIVVPIARPGMAVLAMLTFMTSWNEFFWPIVVLNGTNPTVQVALSELGQGYTNNQAVIMAGTLVCTLPVIVVFALLGKQIVGGILMGAVKS